MRRARDGSARAWAVPARHARSRTARRRPYGSRSRRTTDRWAVSSAISPPCRGESLLTAEHDAPPLVARRELPEIALLHRRRERDLLERLDGNDARLAVERPHRSVRVRKDP